MLTKRLLSQRRSLGTALTALHRSTPTAVPTRWSPLTVLLPSHTPSSHDDSILLRSAPGLLHATASPGMRMTLLYGTLRIFS